MAKDFKERFHTEDGTGMHLFIAYTKDYEPAVEFKEMLQERYPKSVIEIAPLALSISCHIGPGALAVACSKGLPPQ